MLTPQEITNTSLKSGMGYKKKEVEAFLLEVQKSYLELYKENEELKEKASILSEGVQYYKNLEKTLQKSLVLAEKTSNETITAAESKARAIEQEAKTKANLMINDAQKELNQIHNQIIALVQQYEKYKTQCKQFASTQLELLDSSSYELKIPKLDELIEPIREDSLELDTETGKKKISFDLKEDDNSQTNLFQHDELKKADREEVNTTKVNQETVNFSAVNQSEINLNRENQSEINLSRENLSEVNLKKNIKSNMPGKNSDKLNNNFQNRIEEEKEYTDINCDTPSDTQPLPEVKEIFMNANDEKKKAEQTVILPDLKQRNLAKEAGFCFSDEEELEKAELKKTEAAKKDFDFSEQYMNHGTLKEDMEINDVLSRLKNSFK